MKKFKKIEKLEVSKFETSKIKKENLFNVKGGCTCGTRSACHVDGADEGDASFQQF